jgi:hypothetical protein
MTRCYTTSWDLTAWGSGEAPRLERRVNTLVKSGEVSLYPAQGTGNRGARRAEEVCRLSVFDSSLLREGR